MMPVYGSSKFWQTRFDKSWPRFVHEDGNMLVHCRHFGLLGVDIHLRGKQKKSWIIKVFDIMDECQGSKYVEWFDGPLVDAKKRAEEIVVESLMDVFNMIRFGKND